MGAQQREGIGLEEDDANRVLCGDFDAQRPVSVFGGRERDMLDRRAAEHLNHRAQPLRLPSETTERDVIEGVEVPVSAHRLGPKHEASQQALLETIHSRLVLACGEGDGGMDAHVARGVARDRLRDSTETGRPRGSASADQDDIGLVLGGSVADRHGGVAGDKERISQALGELPLLGEPQRHRCDHAGRVLFHLLERLAAEVAWRAGNLGVVDFGRSRGDGDGDERCAVGLGETQRLGEQVGRIGGEIERDEHGANRERFGAFPRDPDRPCGALEELAADGSQSAVARSGAMSNDEEVGAERSGDVHDGLCRVPVGDAENVGGRSIPELAPTFVEDGGGTLQQVRTYRLGIVPEACVGEQGVLHDGGHLADRVGDEEGTSPVPAGEGRRRTDHIECAIRVTDSGNDSRKFGHGLGKRAASTPRTLWPTGRRHRRGYRARRLRSCPATCA